jgi:hypothetical protein
MNEINELNDDLINDLFELDTSWVDEFDKNDNEYKSYYNEELTFINLHCIYINKNSEISKIHEEKILFKTPGTLSREEVIGPVDPQPGELTTALREELTGIQYGLIPDRHNWLVKLSS